MHEYVKVFMDSNTTLSFPKFTEEDWDGLVKASPFTKEHIDNILNVPDIDPTVVATTLFQLVPREFVKVFPERGKKLLEIFSY